MRAGRAFPKPLMRPGVLLLLLRERCIVRTVLEVYCEQQSNPLESMPDSLRKVECRMKNARIDLPHSSIGLIKCAIGAFVGILALLWLSPSLAFAAQGADRDEVAEFGSALVSAVMQTEDYQSLFGIDFTDQDVFLGTPIAGVEEKGDVYGETGTEYWPVVQGGIVRCFVVTTAGDGEETAYRLTSLGIDESGIILDEGKEYVVVDDGCGERLVAIEDSDEVGHTADMMRVGGVESVNPSKAGSAPIRLNTDPSLWDFQQAPPEAEVTDDPGAIRSAAKAAPSLIPQLLIPCRKQADGSLRCWANSVASIGQYLTGVYMSDETICQTIKGSNNVGGSAADAVAGLRLFTYPSVTTRISALAVTSVVSDSDIKRWINNGMPIYASLRYNSSGHAVVVCGWYTASTGKLAAYIMNPSSGSYEVMTKNGLDILTLDSKYLPFSWSNGSVLLVGWQKPFGGDKWSYFASSGVRKTGWLKDAGHWYYFNGSGYMLQSCWVKDAGHWYYLDKWGAMKTGWVRVEGYWYYLDSSGAMKTGWVKDDGSWYYLRPAANKPASGPEGAMLANGTWTIDGKAYRFSSSGVCLNP